MMTRIKNTSRASQGVHCVDGVQFVEAGKTRTLNVAPEYMERLKALPFLILNDDIEEGPSKLPESVTLSRDDMEQMRLRFENMTAEIDRLTNDLRAARDENDGLTKQLGDAHAELDALRKAPPAKLEAKHRGGGSYSVIDADGKEVLEKLSKADAEAFNGMTAEEQAAYVAKG